MSTPFRITPLSVEPFAHLFELTDAELRSRGMRRTIADAKPGFPCRISLEDAGIGESVLLLPHTHHPVAGPYRASGPIFVREGARPAAPAVNEVPDSVRTRFLSVRAYDSEGMMVASDATEGEKLEAVVTSLFADPRAAYLHVHNARAGCYSCRIDRA